MLRTAIIDEIKEALDELSFLPRAFSFQELEDTVNNKIEPDVLEKYIIEDERFVSLDQKIIDKSLFFSKHILLNKFISLNQGLCRANQVKISSRKVALYMSSLLPSSKWETLPERIFLFGCGIGLIAPAINPEEYVFPLAHILSYLSPSLIRDTVNILNNIDTTENNKASSNIDYEDLFKECFSGLDERCIYIFSNREGLSGFGKKTLEELGVKLGITRERVRQIEKKTWQRLNHPSRKQIFLKAFLLDFVKRQGKLIFNTDIPTSQYQKFVLKCLNIPYSHFVQGNLIVAGIFIKDFKLPDYTETRGLKGNEIILLLESQGKLCLSKSDISVLCENEQQFTPKHLTKIQKIYQTMRLLEKPAHFSIITEEYNKLFPEDNIGEHNIHAILCRKTDIFIWLGIKGTYGLKEWGCQRPQKSLYETVTEIVKKRYKQTKKPVPLTTIVAELGKYRQIVNPVSLNFVTTGNPKLQIISKDLFLPKKHKIQREENNSLDILDEALQKFSDRENL